MAAPLRHTTPVRRQRDDAGDFLTAEALRERAEDAARRRESEREAYAAWQLGDVVPHRITLALDIHDLDGPGVDEACGTAEPAVDEWEAGTRYPTWEQLLALAALTGYPAGFFTAPVDAVGPTVAFICNRSRRNWNPHVEIPAPLLAFDPAAIAATIGGYCAGCAGHPLPHTCQQTTLF